jgi:putative restriction endonuclease
VIGNREWRARLAAFEWLSDLGAPEGEVSRTLLVRGFDLDGVRIPLVGPQGIWKPAGFQIPLSIATIPSGPYHDRVDETRRLRYAYRGSDPNHRDNVGLRLAKDQKTPLIYFYRTDPGRYLATYPVYVVDDDPRQLAFWVEVDHAWALDPAAASAIDELPETPLRREYATRTVRQRLFQVEFRRRVVQAYQERCALCRLRHRELLDAAHITADANPEGEPVVSNGMALCKLHHAAFDSFFFTVTPDYLVEVRPSIRKESDGPMLIVGLQQIHGTTIYLPKRAEQQPDRDRLASRYEAFRQAS